MKKFLLAAPFAVVALGIAAVASPAFAAQPTTTTHNVDVPAASEAFIDLPALNSQFTKMVIKVNDGTANWGITEQTTYLNGNPTGTPVLTSGIAYDPVKDIHYGPILAEGTQVGAVIYRVDGENQWHEVTNAAIDPPGAGTHHVQIAYNDRPGNYDDNSGALSVNVVRSK